MAFVAEPQTYSRCCSVFYNLIDRQRRHFCIGAVICCLACGTIIAEFQQTSPIFAGYWMGSVDFLAVLTAFLCAIKPHRNTFLIATVIDVICTMVNVTGTVQLLALRSSIFYNAGWLGVVTVVFLIYHGSSCVYDASTCCRWNVLNEVETASSSSSIATSDSVAGANANESAEGETRRVDSSNRGNGRGEERRQRRRTQSPPADFRLPDEIPKLPSYDELGTKDGLPPAYDDLSEVNHPVSPSRRIATTENQTTAS